MYRITPLLLAVFWAYSAQAQCDITITETTVGDCTVNGTPYDPTDDTFPLTVNASVVDGGASNQFNVSDGTNTYGPFTYGTGGVINLVPDGTDYTLVFSDANDNTCTATPAMTFSQAPCCEINITETLVPVTSNHPNTGQIQLCLETGTPPFHIAVTPQTNASIYEVPGNCLYNYVISGLPTNDYTVVVTDSLDCQTILQNLSISNEDCTGFLLQDIIGNPTTCKGADDGTMEVTLFDPGNASSITVDVGNGVPPQTFNDLGNISLTNLPPGTYNVALFDNNGCEVTYLYNPVIINEPGPVNMSGTATDLSAAGEDDGAVTLCLDGANSGFTVSIEPDTGNISGGAVCPEGGEGFLISDLPDGTYDVIGTDSKGCADTLHVIINAPECPLALDIQTTDLDCGGTATGLMDVTVTGGTPPYSISLDGGETFSTPQNNPTFSYTDLTAGNYDVIINDDSGCSASSNTHIILTEEEPLTITGMVMHATSVGGTEGQLDICVNGGMTGYDIAISPDAGTIVGTGSDTDCDTTYSIDNLPADTYTITITDDLGCTQTWTETVLEPTCSDFYFTEVVGDTLSCYGARDGSLTVSFSGAGAPYTIEIPGIQNITTSDITHTFEGLENGGYEIFVTAENGCFLPYASAYVLPEPEPLSSVISSIPACVGESNGLICLIPEQGTPGYSYNVLNQDQEGQDVVEGPNSECIGAEFHVPDLPSGLYHVELVDTNGCKAHAVTNISEVTVTVNAEITPTCTGQNLGAIDISAGGGAMPYVFDWGDGVTDEDRTNLAAGTYEVTVTDNRGCQGIGTFAVEISDPALSFQNDPTCAQLPAGTINATVTNGVADYSYTWSGTSSGESASDVDVFSIPDLAAGNYNVQLTDSRGCTADANTTIDDSTFEVQMAGDDTCEGQNNGQASAIPSAGVMPFLYDWSSGDDTDVAQNLAAGTYTVTVTDGNGCTATGQQTINEYPLAPSLMVANVCLGQSSGNIEVVVDNAQGPLEYSWSNGGVTNPLFGLDGGDYTVTVTDQSGCTATGEASVGQFDSPSVSASEDVTILQGNSTTLSADASGGSSPYDYIWQPNSGSNPNSSSNEVTPSQSQTYFITVLDANGCSASDTVRVTVIDDVLVVMPTAFSPNGDGNNEVYEPFIPNGDASVLRIFRIFNRWGQVVHDDPDNPWDGKLSGADQPVGTYVYVVEYTNILNEQVRLKGHFSLVR